MKGLIKGIATLFIVTMVITAIPEGSAGYLGPIKDVFSEFRSDISITTKEKLGMPTGAEATIIEKANKKGIATEATSLLSDLFSVKGKGTPITDFSYSVKFDNDVEKELANGLLEGREVISVPRNEYTETQLEYMLQKSVYQNPLVLYVDRYYFANNTYFITYKEEQSKAMEEKQLAAVEEAKRIAYSNLTQEMSDKEKAAVIGEILYAAIQYDDAAADEFTNNNYTFSVEYADSQNVYGALVNKKAVCSGFAKSFKLIADSVGLDTRLVIGTHRGVPHIWNMVQIDGAWHYIDATNNVNEMYAKSTYKARFGRGFNTDYIVNEVY